MSLRLLFDLKAIDKGILSQIRTTHQCPADIDVALRERILK